MTTVNHGRFTAADDDVTVFLIGMRFNQPWRADLWWPVFVAMPRMLRHLAANRQAGLLGQQAWLGRTTLLLSYWRDAESLRRFAADPQAPHLQPWRDFVRKVSASGVVGIWHETYVVPAANREVIYHNMPDFGLGRAVGLVPVAAGSNTAAQRFGRTVPPTAAPPA